MYHRTNITFLRADSGYFQMLAQQSAAEQQRTIRHFWRDSVDGHYTPVAFTAEFLFTRLVETKTAIWRWRQMSAVAAIVAALFIVTTSALRASGYRPLAARCVGAGIATAFLAHPLMTDLIAWPFHIVQLAWMFSTTVTLGLLLRVGLTPSRPVWTWLAAASGYGAMHVLGLGFVTAVATAAVLLTYLVFNRRTQWRVLGSEERHLACAIVLLVTCTLLHALAMALLVTPHEVPFSSFKFTLAHALGLISSYPLFAVLGQQGVIVEPRSAAEVVRCAWPFGLALLLAAFAVLVRILRSYRQGLRGAERQRLALLVFSLASFLVAVLMISARQWKLPSDLGLFGYLTGPRYLMTVSMTLYGAFLLCLTRVPPIRQTAVAAVCLAAGMAACLAHQGYKDRVLAHIAPLNRISHERAWRLIVSSAREARGAGLPVPNVPLGALTQEFNTFDLRLYAPLLRTDLGLRDDEPCEFTEWRLCRTTLREEYSRAVPSLDPLIALLKLDGAK